MRTFTTLLTALALLIAPLASAQAFTAQDEVGTTVEADRAEITLTNTTNDTTATVTVTLDTAEGLLGTNLSVVDQAQDLDVNVTLHQLAEYRAGEDEEALTDNATVVSAWNIAEGSENVTAEANGTLQWAPLEEENVTADDGETEGVLITGQAIFPGEQPDLPLEEPAVEGQPDLPTLEERNVTIELVAFGQQATYNGQDVGPLQTLATFHVNDYPYEAEDTDLALVMEANQAVHTINLDDAALKSTETYEGIDVDLAIAWNDEATIDDQGTPVDATQPTPDEDADADDLVALSYERGEIVQHAGLIGASLSEMDDDAPSFNTDDVPAPGILAVLTGIAGIALVARRAR